MRDQFEVWDCDFPVKGKHPVVLISHPDICAQSKHVNVLFCTSQRQSRKPYPYEVALDSADGLDWETFCNCAILYLVDVVLLTRKRGRVSHERRNAIRTKVRDHFLLSASD